MVEEDEDDAAPGRVACVVAVPTAVPSLDSRCGTMRPSIRSASNSTVSVPLLKVTSTRCSSGFSSCSTTVQPDPGVADTIRNWSAMTSTVTVPASPTEYAVRSPEPWIDVDVDESIAARSTVVGSGASSAADSLATTGSLSKIWVLTTAAAVPAVRTPTTESAVAIRVFMVLLLSATFWAGPNGSDRL